MKYVKLMSHYQRMQSVGNYMARTHCHAKQRLFNVMKPKTVWVATALTMETASTSETLLNFYQAGRRYNPEDNHFHLSSFNLICTTTRSMSLKECLPTFMYFRTVSSSLVPAYGYRCLPSREHSCERPYITRGIKVFFAFLFPKLVTPFLFLLRQSLPFCSLHSDRRATVSYTLPTVL
jgi:hypothetical protein